QANAIVGNFNAVRLSDQNVRRDGLTAAHIDARRPKIICYEVLSDRSLRAEPNLNAVLRGPSRWTHPGDDVSVDDDDRTNLITGNSVFLKIVKGIARDLD